MCQVKTKSSAAFLCRLVYLGPSHLALPYFESLGFALPRNENPADFCMDVLSGRWAQAVALAHMFNCRPAAFLPVMSGSFLVSACSNNNGCRGLLKEERRQAFVLVQCAPCWELSLPA